MEADSVRDEPLARPTHTPGEAPTVLSLHGFTGTPLEAQLACEAGAELGLRTVAPVLAGHGTTSAELSLTAFDDWVESARTVFDAERKRGPVILSGLSAGTLIAARLALDAPADVLGLVLMANAFWLKAPYPSHALDVLARTGLPNIGARKRPPELNPQRARHVSYQIQPLRAAIELQEAGKRLREVSYRIHRPTYIFHGARDSICPVANAWNLARLIGPAVRRVSIYPETRHVMTRDVERFRLKFELLQVLSELTGRVPARTSA